MTHRDLSPQFNQMQVHPNQIERPGRNVVQYGPGFPQPRQVARHPRPFQPPQISVNPPRVEIQSREDIVEPPDSIEYATPIHISMLSTPQENPELDEEFDLDNLGIDLQTVEPLLPNVYHVGSDSPMMNLGQFPVPNSYPRTQEEADPAARMVSFSDEALLFVFYLHARDKLQECAFAELTKRRFIYDPDKQRWFNRHECVFDVDTWKFVQPDEFGRVPVRQ